MRRKNDFEIIFLFFFLGIKKQKNFSSIKKIQFLALFIFYKGGKDKKSYLFNHFFFKIVNTSIKKIKKINL